MQAARLRHAQGASLRFGPALPPQCRHTPITAGCATCQALPRGVAVARREGIGRRIEARVWRALGARGDVVLGLPLITLEGSERLALENHQGVAEYTPTKLVALTVSGPVRVCGTGLKMVSLSKQSLVVQGALTSVTFGAGEAE